MTFRVATYNVLAAAYADRRLYPRTPDHALDAGYRRSLLPQYLLRLDADVICLQEVEAETFAILENAPALEGYLGSFAMKGRDKPDGCAMLVRAASVALVRHSRLPYNDGAPNRAMSGHIAQIATLRVDDRRLAVANTHLKWDSPDQPREALLGVRQIEELLAARQVLEPEADGWIVAGDLNVTPDCAVVTALRAAGFELSHAGAPAPTCVANGEARMIDYLFGDGALTASPLPITPLAGDAVLPGVSEPSDHVPLCAAFRWHPA